MSAREKEVEVRGFVCGGVNNNKIEMQTLQCFEANDGLFNLEEERAAPTDAASDRWLVLGQWRVLFVVFEHLLGFLQLDVVALQHIREFVHHLLVD
jgi:hypothetical protein